jgi:hypothetical protein
MIADAFKSSLDDVLMDRLRKPGQRSVVVSTVMEGFGLVQKKPVPDLPQRILDMEKRVRKMSEQVGLGFVNGRLVVKVAGSSESLMTELRRGSDWYLPWPEVDEVVLAAILIDPPK